MGDGLQERAYSVAEAVKAQKALREAAGLGPELFPVRAFVGMISDEIEALRERGLKDEQIVALIEGSSEIRISVREIEENYASGAKRHGSRG